LLFLIFVRIFLNFAAGFALILMHAVGQKRERSCPVIAKKGLAHDTYVIDRQTVKYPIEYLTGPILSPVSPGIYKIIMCLVLCDWLLKVYMRMRRRLQTLRG